MTTARAISPDDEPEQIAETKFLCSHCSREFRRSELFHGCPECSELVCHDGLLKLGRRGLCDKCGWPAIVPLPPEDCSGPEVEQVQEHSFLWVSVVVGLCALFLLL